MNRKLTVFCGVTALLLTACGQPDTRQADAQALKDLEGQWNQDFVAKNLDKLTAHYTDNAVLMAPGIPSASTKDDIKKLLSAMVADPAFTLTFQAARAEVAKSGDVAYTQGTYQMTMTDPASKSLIHDHGSYVTTYNKQSDGSWKAVADIATSEVPPPAPAPPAAGKK